MMPATTRTAHVVIVGASHAGLQAAQSLRQGGWTGPITLFSAEKVLPYQRPDMSKGFLTGDNPDPAPLKGAPFFAANDITLRLDTRITGLDRTTRRLTTGSGEVISFDRLIIATGAVPRRLGVEAENIHVLRDLTDARALRAELRPDRRIAVIGGGFIGLEVAAAARKHGAGVTVLEAAPQCLSRALPTRMTDFLLARHRAEGVAIHTGCGAVTPIVETGRVTALRLADGRAIPCDAVVVGIGCVADIGFASKAGLRTEAGGLAVDGRLVTSDPGIQAIGDCAAFSSSQVPGPVRLESIQNATDQARHAAAVLLGAEGDFSAVPWFWSHQYDLRLQMAGFPRPDAPMLLRGDLAKGSFSLLHIDETNRLVAAYSMNAAADHIAARKLIGGGAILDPIRAVDTAVPLTGAQVIAA